jgi:hypothetical protein
MTDKISSFHRYVEQQIQERTQIPYHLGGCLLSGTLEKDNTSSPGQEKCQPYSWMTFLLAAQLGSGD